MENRGVNDNSSFTSLNKKTILFSFLSLCAVATQFAVGITLIPSSVLINFVNYGRDSLTLLQAMWKYISSNTALTFVAWLMPILPASYLPLKFTSIPLGISTIVVMVILLGSFLSPTESVRFVEMIKTVPEIGYMWYETISISLVTMIISPTYSLLLWAGPAACACLGEIETKRSSIPFILIAVAGIILVLPTVHIFINANGEFFLLGYKTDSLAGKLLSTSFIFIWIRTYHLVCRDGYLTFQQFTTTWKRVLAVLWVLVGTALVEVWVSSAFTLHFAYVSVVGVKLEGSFESMIMQYMPIFLRYTKSCFDKSRKDNNPI